MPAWLIRARLLPLDTPLWLSGSALDPKLDDSRIPPNAPPDKLPPAKPLRRAEVGGAPR